MLGGISQSRVSQLSKAGDIIGEPDSQGRMQYDRASVERLAKLRAVQRAASAEHAEEKVAMGEEARARFRRQRAREKEEAERRQAHLDELREREVNALEGILACLKQRQR